MYKKIRGGDIKKGRDEVLGLPRTVRMCGIIPDDQEVYKYLNKIAASEIEEDDECPPPPRKKEERERFNCDSSEDSEEENKDGEWIRVAGDGACPGGGNKDYRLPRSGSGIYYGKNNRHNSSWKNKGTAQSAQRAEVEAAWRWTAWAWAKQIYLTDSAQVKYKLERMIKENQGIKRERWKEKKNMQTCGEK